MDHLAEDQHIGDRHGGAGHEHVDIEVARGRCHFLNRNRLGHEASSVTQVESIRRMIAMRVTTPL